MHLRFERAWAIAGVLLLAGRVIAAQALPSNALAPAVPASAVEQTVQQLRDEKHFGSKHPERYLRFKREDKKNDHTEPAPSWFIEFVAWLNRIGRVGVWTLGAIAIALLAVLALRAARKGASGDGGVGDVRTAPASVRQYDIRPESLPADIGTAAWAQWRAGERRAALVLLYRGALSRLVHQHAVPIRGSNTEGDCMTLALRHLADHRSDYFARVTRVRLLASYADRWPHEDDMRELCQLFEMRLAALPAA